MRLPLTLHQGQPALHEGTLNQDATEIKGMVAGQRLDLNFKRQPPKAAANPTLTPSTALLPKRGGPAAGGETGCSNQAMSPEAGLTRVCKNPRPLRVRRRRWANVKNYAPVRGKAGGAVVFNSKDDVRRSPALAGDQRQP